MWSFFAMTASATPGTATSASATLMLPIDVPGCQKNSDGKQSAHNPCAHVISLLSRSRISIRGNTPACQRSAMKACI